MSSAWPGTQLAKEKQLKEWLEKDIDAHSLTVVLALLAEICAEKGEHLLTNWQDEVSAERWNKMSHDIDLVAFTADSLKL